MFWFLVWLAGSALALALAPAGPAVLLIAGLGLLALLRSKALRWS